MRVDLDIGAPPGWRVHDEPDRGIAVAFTGPGSTPSGLPPTITVVAEVAAATSLEGLLATRRAEACRLLTGAAVEEEGLLRLTGRRAGYLRLVHTIAGHDLSAELWTWRSRGGPTTPAADRDPDQDPMGDYPHSNLDRDRDPDCDREVVWTVTATVDRALWPEYSALFERVADSWRPSP